MDIFGQTPVPKWLDPQETQFKWMDENRQDENAQTQRHVAMGQLALQQQEQDLRNKMGAADLVTKGMANQTMAMDLNQHIQGVDEWNNIMQQTGGDPEKIYNSPAPSSPFALQKWSSARAGYAQSVAGAAKVKMTSDFYTKLAGLDPQGFASVNDMVNSEDGMNDDGTPTRAVMEELANQGQRMIDEKRAQEVAVRKAGPEVTAGSRENVATIQAGARVDSANIMADSRKYVGDRVQEARQYASDTAKQINTDKLAKKLQGDSYNFLPHAEYDALHQQMEDIRKNAPQKDRQQLLEKAFNDAVQSHRSRMGQQQAAPTPAAEGDGSSQDKPKPVTSQDEYNSAPSGTWVVDPSGKVGRKP